MTRPDSPTDRRRFLARTLRAGVGLSALNAAATRPALASPRQAPDDQAEPLRVLLWCEGTAPRSVYPDDVDGALVEYLGRQKGLEVGRARLTEVAAGLSDDRLDATDVVVWWGRLRHDDLPDDRAEAVARRVREGSLGLVALHSACCSKPFRSLMGMPCEPGAWREDGLPEHVAVQAVDHPITRGISNFVIPRSDMFAEPFAVPEPEAVVLVSTWGPGESVRSGLTWTVGSGRVVYLRAGHDAFPVLFHPSVRRLITNAAVWAGGRS